MSAGHRIDIVGALTHSYTAGLSEFFRIIERSVAQKLYYGQSVIL